MNRYVLKTLLGEGGMGVVYEARKILPGDEEMPVACKIMRSTMKSRRTFTNLFYQEAMLNLRISHKHRNVVTVYDFFEGQYGDLYLIMELVEGCTLADVIDRSGPLPPETVAYVADRLLDALEHIHGYGVLHRDISPCNVLVSRSGEVLIADFGLAHFIASVPAEPGRFRGKFAYASPEVFRGTELDPRTDLYSIGATLYAMLAGHAPFGDDVSGPEMKQRLDDWQAPPLPGSVPDKLRTLTMSLLEAEPSARPPAAQDARKPLAALAALGDFEVARADLAGRARRVHDEIQQARREQGETEAAERIEAPNLVHRESQLRVSEVDDDEPDPEESRQTQDVDLADDHPDPLDPRRRKRKRWGHLALVTLVAVAVGSYALTDERTVPTQTLPPAVEQPVVSPGASSALASAAGPTGASNESDAPDAPDTERDITRPTVESEVPSPTRDRSARTPVVAPRHRPRSEAQEPPSELSDPEPPSRRHLHRGRIWRSSRADR